jgi:hypothetical protein
MNRTTLRNSVAIVAGIGVLAGASGALAVSSTMPAASPVGGNSGNQLQFSVPANKILQKKAVSYFYMSNGGGQVKITAPTFKGYDTFQTATITPPSGQTVIQGMSTISGGDLGSMIIQSTSSSSSAYTIKLKFPGSQGTPGKLTFRLQLGTKS